MKQQSFYWSVRREIWENRSILWVPCIGAALFVAMFAGTRIAPEWTPIGLRQWCAFTAGTLCLLSVANALFYSLDALYGERRDRSILFWKSMPVSDLVAVLSKAFIPLAVIPAITFVTIVAAQLLMVLIEREFPAQLPQMTLDLLLGLVVMALWQAPVHAWVLLVSGWARRAVLASAALVPLAACVMEQLLLGTDHLTRIVTERLTVGIYSPGFGGIRERLSALSAAHLASDPNLWIGLAVAALLLAATVRLRRHAQPI